MTMLLMTSAISGGPAPVERTRELMAVRSNVKPLLADIVKKKFFDASGFVEAIQPAQVALVGDEEAACGVPPKLVAAVP